MAVEKDKLSEVLKQLPEDLKDKVLRFAESLVKSRLTRAAGSSFANGSPSIRSLFGSWESDDPHSADNDLIDTDLAREYASSHC